MPIFTRLDASHIAEIARLLRLQVMPAYTIIVRRGDPADAMYFIMSGEVDVEVAPKPVRLKAGDHFGEVGLLSDSTRNATVIAASDCQLLALGVGEFRQLIDRHPEIRAHFERVAAERMMPGGIGSRPPAVN